MTQLRSAKYHASAGVAVRGPAQKARAAEPYPRLAAGHRVILGHHVIDHGEQAEERGRRGYQVVHPGVTDLLGVQRIRPEGGLGSGAWPSRVARKSLRISLAAW
jgi:hypothetical protein